MSQKARGSVPYSLDTSDALLGPHQPKAGNSPKIEGTPSPLDHSNFFLKQELSTDPLNRMRRHLWMAGTRAQHGIRPLHRQYMLGREITVCEQVWLHLVSHNRQIFIKPLPRWILRHSFYKEEILPHVELRNHAEGFLLTYLLIIRHETDFNIAREKRLLPATVTWESWISFYSDLDKSLYEISATGSPRRIRSFGNRFDFGELRLNRLNLISRVFQYGTLARGFQVLDESYSSFFSSTVAGLLVVFAFLSLALASFQVTQGYANPAPSLINLSYWFALATLVLLALFVLIPIGWFMVLFMSNALFAWRTRY